MYKRQDVALPQLDVVLTSVCSVPLCSTSSISQEILLVLKQNEKTMQLQQTAVSISNIDIGIVISYFVVVIAIGLWIARSTKTGEDYFLGGRSFGWGLIGLSLFASNISSSTIIGLTGAAYTTGIVNSVYEWMSGIPLIIAALIFIPLYLESRITTIPEYLERRFDRRSQLFFSAVSIFATIVVETAGGLYAGTLVIQAFFPDLGLWQTALGLALIAGTYTAFGGLKAVVYTCLLYTSPSPRDRG